MIVRRSTVLTSAVQVSAGTVLVLLSSSAVTILAGALFGTTRATDSLVMALTIPAVLVTITSLAPTLAAVPALVQARTVAGDETAERVSRSLLTVGLLCATALGALVLAFREPIVAALTPGFDQEARALTAALLGFTVPASVCTAGINALVSTLNARRRFFIAALAPAIANFIAFVALASFGHQGIWAWAAGQLAGSLTAFLTLIATAVRAGVGLRPTLALRDPWSVRVAQAAWPFVLLAVIVQAANLAVRQVMSLLPGGAITALNLAVTLTLIPLGLAAYALGTALVPAFAEAVLGERERLEALFARAVKLLLIVLVPTGILLSLLAEPIVRILLERGAFDTGATALTASGLRLYALSLISEAVLVVAHRALLGASATRTLLWTGALQAAVLVVLTVALAGPFGHLGVAAAYTISVFLNTALLADAARRRFGLRRLGETLRFAVTVLALALVACVPAALVGMTALESDLARTALTGALAAAAYALLLRYTGMADLPELYRLLRARGPGLLADEVNAGVR